MAGRTTVDAPWIGCVLVLNEGTMARSCSFRSPVPCLSRSVEVSTSTGTADAVTLRASAREPTTTVSSRKPASRPCISAGDNPRPSTSAGAIPSARPSSSTSASVCSATCSCGPSAWGAPRASDASTVHTVRNTARAGTTPHRKSRPRFDAAMVRLIVSTLYLLRFLYSGVHINVADTDARKSSSEFGISARLANGGPVSGGGFSRRSCWRRAQALSGSSLPSAQRPKASRSLRSSRIAA